MVALFGREHGIYAWWSRATGASHDHVSRCLRGKGGMSPPEEWVALVELLEATPKDNWPERWRKSP